MKFFVTCAKGTEGALRRELVELKIHAPRGDRGGVSFEGTLAEGAKVCLWSRVGMRVLLELGAFDAPDADALYEGVQAIEWSDHLSARSTLAVSAHVAENPELRHSGFAALKVKDAVVDALRDRLGSRPNVDARDPDVAIVLHLDGSAARLYLDLAGEPLHRRGYRVAMTEAPLKETLAAAILSLGGARTDEPLLDPMTGSGTFAIEQALRARRIAPGLRRSFSLERWPSDAGRAALARLREEASAAAAPKAPAPITAGDLLPAAVEAARRNARAAGVESDIVLEVADARRLAVAAGPGTVCINPPYGERLGADPRTDAHQRVRGGRDMPVGRPPARSGPPALRAGGSDLDGLDRLYRELATSLRELEGWQLVVLAGSPRFLPAMGMRPEVSHRLWNGPIETRLLRYRL